MSRTTASSRIGHVLLVFPPLNPLILHPELGIPQLVAYLKLAGLDAPAVDLNARFLGTLWSDEAWVDGVMRDVSPSDRGRLVGLVDRILDLRLATIESLNRSVSKPLREQHADGLSSAILAMTDGMVYTPLEAQSAPREARCEEALAAWRRGLALPESHQWTVRRILAHWVDGLLFRPDSWDAQSVAAAVLRPCPLYEQFLTDSMEPMLFKSQMLGLSLQASEQLVPALKLARWARQRGWQGHITLGGPWARVAADNLRRMSAIWPFFDSVAVGESELALLQMVKQIESEDSPRPVPGMLRRSGDTILDGGPAPTAPLRTLPPPDYGFVDWEAYPERAVAFRTTRGCYWSRCTFCFHVTKEDREIRQAPPVDDCIPQLEALLAAEVPRGARCLRLADNATSPELLDQVAATLKRHKQSVEWEALARFDPGFDPVRCRRLAASGLRGLTLGLEVADDGELQRLDKGITLQTVLQTLHACAEAGIRASLFILDYPTLPRESLRRTLDFCCEHADKIHWLIPFGFQLGLNAHVVRAPESLGLQVQVDPLDWYSVFDVPFVAKGWRSESQRNEIFREGLVRFAAVRWDWQNRNQRQVG